MTFLIPIVLLLLANPDTTLYPMQTGTFPHDGFTERYGYALEPLPTQIGEISQTWEPSSPNVISCLSVQPRGRRQSVGMVC